MIHSGHTTQHNTTLKIDTCKSCCFQANKRASRSQIRDPGSIIISTKKTHLYSTPSLPLQGYTKQQQKGKVVHGFDLVPSNAIHEHKTLSFRFRNSALTQHCSLCNAYYMKQSSAITSCPPPWLVPLWLSLRLKVLSSPFSCQP